MTRLSGYLLPTEKQAPADAEALSHKLLVRAGMVKQVGSGLWTWLPAGWRVHQKISQIIREEMDAIGGQELLMPVLQPADLWQRSGRYPIAELFKLQDRRGADMVLAMTNEECITAHVAQFVRSYRDLPQILYHFQIKERDEPRPRAGVLRTREFIMKDAYTFDRDREGLDEGYEKHVGAYGRIFDRLGLEWYSVESDVGMMRERRRARARLCGEPRGRERGRPARRAARGAARAGAGADAGTDHGRRGRRGARSVGRSAVEGLPGDRRGRAAARDAARRSPRQRRQASERARRRRARSCWTAASRRAAT
jgi:hypothetical protein